MKRQNRKTIVSHTSKQLGFQLLELKNTPLKKGFGGSLLKNSNAKKARPITTKRSMHLVMRSSQAIGAFSLRRKDEAIYSIISKQAGYFGVKVYRFANAGNHLHMVILPRSRSAYYNFIRSISGLIARLILRAERNSSPQKSGKFWDQRPFTRVVEWGKEFETLGKYLLQNVLESYGFTSYSPRFCPTHARDVKHSTA